MGRSRLTALLLTLLILCSTSCGSQQLDMDNNMVSKEPVTFSFFNVDRNDGMWDDPVAQAITEATGVRLRIEYPQEDGASQISLMLATSNLPDLIYAKGSCSDLIENGALIDMSGLIDEHGPNIKKLYGSHYDWLRYSAEDPSIYQLCSLAKSDNVEETNGTV